MSTTGSRESVLESTSHEVWSELLDSYWDVLREHKTKPKLHDLERWFVNTLQESVARTGVFTKNDLIKLIEWKGTRGKFRPALVRFAKDQSDDAVCKASRKAFAALRKDKSETLSDESMLIAMKPLLDLRGIGPATASAILSSGDARIPFMSDELLMACLRDRKYTLKHYFSMVEKLKDARDRIRPRTGEMLTLRDMERIVFVSTLCFNRKRKRSD
jgi:hypothetical protein